MSIFIMVSRNVSFQIIMKWGEYSNDVQFILQRNDGSTKSPNISKPKSSNHNNQIFNGPVETSEKQKDTTKPLTFR